MTIHIKIDWYHSKNRANKKFDMDYIDKAILQLHDMIHMAVLQGTKGPKIK